MKKVISILLAFISVICTTVALTGCEEKYEAGTFYTVAEAYENGYLTREELMSVAYYFNKGREFNEEIMDEDYAPIPKTPETPTKEMDKSIINSFYNSEKWERFKDSRTKEDISYHYYGTYGDAVVVMMWVGTEAVGLAAKEDKIGDVIIYYPDTKRLSVWVKSN